MGDALRATARGNGRPVPHSVDRATAWIDWAVRIFYVHPRTVGRRLQLCLRDSEGRELGWKDTGSGRIMVRGQPGRVTVRDQAGQVTLRNQAGRSSLVQAILEAAGPASVPLSSDNLPGVALDIPGGAVLAQLRLRSAALLVGKESEVPGEGEGNGGGHGGHGGGGHGGGHRLYATFARPGKDTVTLGYVDLHTGEPHPSPESASALHPETAEQLLQAVVERRPREHYP